jgi:hypothetical protein
MWLRRRSVGAPMKLPQAATPRRTTWIVQSLVRSLAFAGAPFIHVIAIVAHSGEAEWRRKSARAPKKPPDLRVSQGG